MDELRWILLGLGALIIIGVYAHGSWEKIREQGWPKWRRKTSEENDRVEPDAFYDDDEILGEVRITRFDEPDSEIELTVEPALEPEAFGDEKIIVLTVMAPEGVQYAGDALADVAQSCGLKLTDQGVFRRGVDTDTGTVAAYTVANILEPGTFDQAKLTEQMTPGVVMIMQLPGPFDGSSTFEQMLATARTIVDRLGGELLDGRRCNLSAQSIEHIREELLEYRRRSELADRRNH